MKLSDKIRILRKARGLSQEELGSRLSRVNEYGISRQTVSDWENGNFEPKLENIRDLAEVLNVTYDALLDETLDLDDADVLYSVLNNNRSTHKEEKITNSFTYHIYPYERDKWALFSIIITPVLFVLIGLAIYVISSDLSKNVWALCISIVIGCGSIGVAVPFLVMLKGNIKRVKYGKDLASCGMLSEDDLMISTYQKASNTIFISLDKIEKMELGENANRRHGSVIIAIKDRGKPLILKDIKEPNKLIEIYNNLDSYIENPDEIKIL